MPKIKKEKKIVLPERKKPEAPKLKKGGWYKCLRCGSKAIKNGGLRETWTCTICGEMDSYYIKRMDE
jgi:hypothetical protein